MLDGLDENLRLIHDRSARELHTALWAATYAVRGDRAVSLSPLTELDSPHLDLVADYCGRAAAAKAGKPRVLLRGPRDSLYAARFLDCTELRSQRRRRNRAKDLALAEQVEQVNNALLRDGVCATELAVPLGTRTRGVPDTITVYVTVEHLYRHSDAHHEWGERDELARQCAVVPRPGDERRMTPVLRP